MEVENLEELREALKADADIVMLDELSLKNMCETVKLTTSRTKLKTSNKINDNTLHVITETNMDYISLGTLTKNMKTVNLSMHLTL